MESLKRKCSNTFTSSSEERKRRKREKVKEHISEDRALEHFMFGINL
jgi:hypothetical protein